MSLTLSILFIPYAILIAGVAIFILASLWHLFKFAPLALAPIIAVITVVLLVSLVMLVTQQAIQTVNWSEPLASFGASPAGLPF